MLTTTDAADILTLVETHAAASLAADPWLGTGGTGGIALIGRGPAGTRRELLAHEFPAIVVSAVVATSNGEAPAGSEEIRVTLVLEAVHRGADRETIAASVAEIAGHLRRWIVDQNSPGGDRLGGLLDDADGTMAYCRVEFVKEKPSGPPYRMTARVQAEARLRAEV